MSTRTIWNDGVEVHNRHLTFESEARIESHKTGILDQSMTGVVSGLTVSVNGGDNTKIDVAAGSGYAPNGEFMELAAGQTALTLASYTLNTVNYVVLVYDEAQSEAEAHESDGTTQYTKATVSPRLVIMTAATYNALPASSDVLTTNAADRAMIVARVTANGPAVALTAGSIESPAVYSNILQASQPVSVAGVIILDVSSDTAVGNGTLAFQISGPNNQLRWTAPGDTAGSWTTVTDGANTIASNNPSFTLDLDVILAGLPDAATSDVIAISNIYIQNVPRFSAEDHQHRNLRGTGIPTTVNPHGMTIDDLSPGAAGSVETHQDSMHANGIVKGSSAGVLAGTVNTGAAPDTLTIGAFTAGDTVYINGRRITAISGSNLITFGDVVSNNMGIYHISMNSVGQVSKTLIAQYPAASVLSGKAQILDVSDSVTGSFDLKWTATGYLSWDNGLAQSMWTDVDHHVRLYSEDGINWVDVWATAGYVPGGDVTESITISARPDTVEDNMPVCNVAFTGASTGFAGFGFGASNAPNFTWDLRQFGNLNDAQTRTDGGIINTSELIRDFAGNGIILRTPNLREGTDGSTALLNEATYTSEVNTVFVLGTVTGGAATLSGGACYIDGKRLEIESVALGFGASVSTQVYISPDGLGVASTAAWEEIHASFHGRSIIRLYEITTDGSSNESSRADRRQYIGGKHDAPYGSVGLNQYKGATITSTSGTGLTVAGRAGVSSPAIAAVHAGSGIGVYSNTLGNYAVSALSSSTFPALLAVSTGGIGAAISSGGNNQAVNAVGSGTGAGVTATGGATGHGVVGAGGGTSGSGGSFTGGGSGTIPSTRSPAVTAGEGHIKLSGTSPATTTVYENTLTPGNLIKAWIKFTLNTPGADTVDAGFNLQSPALIVGATAVTIYFNNLFTTDFCVMCPPSTITASTRTFMPSVVSTTSQTVTLEFYDMNVGNTIDPYDPTTIGGITFYVAIIG